MKTLNKLLFKVIIYPLTILSISGGVANGAELQITKKIWDEFTLEEKIDAQKSNKIIIIPSESIGRIVGAQLVDRSTPGSNSGAVLGSLLAQAGYLGSNGNYSPSSHIGFALIGALIGSSFDNDPNLKFYINYSIKTLDGNVRDIVVQAKSEFVRPNGQCVSFPGLSIVESDLCDGEKQKIIQTLKSISNAIPGHEIARPHTGLMVKCKIPGLGVMTLEKNNCGQMNGEIEK